MEKVKSITQYGSAYELLQEWCGMEWWDTIDSEDDVFLRHFDDFEGFVYFCVNGKDIFVTDFGGDVIAHYSDFSVFLRDIESILKADREERTL